MTQKQISESQLDEIVKLMVKPNAIMNLDENDIRYVLEGKSGFLYVAEQADEDHQTFMAKTFQELSEQSAVKECHYLLMNIGTSTDDPITMDDMDIINDFLAALFNDVMEMKWGMTKNASGQKMTIQVLCTNDLQRE